MGDAHASRLWCVCAHDPGAGLSLLLALRVKGPVACASQGVHRAGEGCSVDHGGDPALRCLLRSGSGGTATSASLVRGHDSRICVACWARATADLYFIKEEPMQARIGLKFLGPNLVARTVGRCRSKPTGPRSSLRSRAAPRAGAALMTVLSTGIATRRGWNPPVPT